MIQRIQTLYLSVAAMSLTLLVIPLGGINWVWKVISPEEDPGSTPMSLPTIHHPIENIGEFILVIISLLLSVTAIFLFSNRQLQLKTGRMATWTTVSALAIATYMGWRDFPESFPMLSWGPGSVLYLLGILMQNLAVRRISQDDKLVRSMDRLR